VNGILVDWSYWFDWFYWFGKTVNKLSVDGEQNETKAESETINQGSKLKEAVKIV
jgi:hypothetical protein